MLHLMYIPKICTLGLIIVKALFKPCVNSKKIAKKVYIITLTQPLSNKYMCIYIYPSNITISQCCDCKCCKPFALTCPKFSLYTFVIYKKYIIKFT